MSTTQVKRIVVGAGAALTALALVSSGADAAGCKSVSGKIALTEASGEECESPVALCWDAGFGGNLAGEGRFTARSLTATADTPTTAVLVGTGDTRLTAKGGTLLTKDAVLLRTAGPGDLAAILTISGGTGDFAGATGSLRVEGTYLVGSGGAGSYRGEVCEPP